MQIQLTEKELSQRYNISETTIVRDFKRVQTKLQKQGVIVTKKKIDKERVYIVSQKFTNQDTALGFTDFDVLKDMDNMSCNILLSLSSLEFNGFGGYIMEFMNNHLDIECNKYQRQLFLNAVQELRDKNYILYTIDPADKDFIMLGLSSKMKRAMQFRQWFIKMCKQIAIQNNMKSYIPLFKVVAALCILINDFGRCKCITYKNITEITGLSAYKIKQCFDALAQDNKIIIGKLQYEIDEEAGEVVRCKGRLIEENVGEQPIQILEDRLGENPFLWEPYYKRDI